jgi:dTMP kinase
VFPPGRRSVTTESVAALDRGVLVAIEGIDGSGKTTQATLLETWARGLGLDVVRSKEPTSGTWGQKIRNSKHTARMAPELELQAFLNDRREHVAGVLNPALARGCFVIVDRYYYSTVAYQGARGVDPGDLLRRNREFAPKPDVVVLLDIDPRVGLERIHKRGQGQDLFETVEELTKARAIFAGLDEPHVLRIDAALSPEQIQASIIFRLMSGPLASWMRSLQRA